MTEPSARDREEARRLSKYERRFWERVEKLPSGCWVWLRGKCQGYGYFWNGRSHVRAHRFAYEHCIGPIPAGRELDHVCRNRACVNPAHLEPVPGRENILRGVGITAILAKRTHCPQGHPYAGDNLYARPNRTHRECRICRKEEQRRRTARCQEIRRREGGHVH